MNDVQVIKNKVFVDKNRNIYDEYRCFCGKVFVTRRASVRSGHTSSCGCYKAKFLRENSITHGKSKTSEFHTWQAMIQRCTNPRNKRYKDYGGRGILICSEWLLSFESFYLYMGPRPKGMSIDRINNDGNYEPGNCRWATGTQQNLNRRAPRL